MLEALSFRLRPSHGLQPPLAYEKLEFRRFEPSAHEQPSSKSEPAQPFKGTEWICVRLGPETPRQYVSSMNHSAE